MADTPNILDRIPNYESAQQTITTAAQLVLSHGLSKAPTLIQVTLVCQSANLGYSIGDELIMNPLITLGSANAGISVVPDATNITIRYSSALKVFGVIEKDTGSPNIADNADWKMVIKAWLL